VDEIVARAARGTIAPGARIVESDIAEALRISRVPVREALRLLESQGIVESEPYKGVRLMSVTRTRLEHVLAVRTALEVEAVQAALNGGRNNRRDMRGLSAALADLDRHARKADPYRFAVADLTFHREICHLSGNPVLLASWESLARQLQIIIGLSSNRRPLHQILRQHQRLLTLFHAGEPNAAIAELRTHFRPDDYGLTDAAAPAWSGRRASRA
jgi:DNA-binding GntR family transcriptional regulator